MTRSFSARLPKSQTTLVQCLNRVQLWVKQATHWTTTQAYWCMSWPENCSNEKALMPWSSHLSRGAGSRHFGLAHGCKGFRLAREARAAWCELRASLGTLRICQWVPLRKWAALSMCFALLTQNAASQLSNLHWSTYACCISSVLSWARRITCLS